MFKVWFIYPEIYLYFMSLFDYFYLTTRSEEAFWHCFCPGTTVETQVIDYVVVMLEKAQWRTRDSALHKMELHIFVLLQFKIRCIGKRKYWQKCPGE